MGRFEGGHPLGATAAGTIPGFPAAGMGLGKKDRFIVELLDGIDSFRTRPTGIRRGLCEANILTALMGGKALTASELAREAGVTQQTASSHLRKLEDGGVVSPLKQGRHK